ncbi:MAG: UDP-N-acetylmuramyl-tripeptide synthetase, partial [Acidimicrobiia bacterium]|nr:UDP-N-acetylmuramyl-tripeptide synthetase [Acidimicrobiia bacterium]
LDLHGSTEDYFRAKASLFRPGLAAFGVTNLDDAHGRLLADIAPIEMVGFSAADATAVEVGVDRVRFTWRGEQIAVAMGGSFNVMNALAAATTATVLGVEVQTIAAGLASAEPVPGRFERIARDGSVVVVDYAHTPDGLQQVIAAARDVAGDGRLLLVFGCGGDRDHAKRPQMGEVAARLADVVVVTSDNPRSEPPLGIIDDVISGMPPDARDRVTVEPDRRAAIAKAIAEAGTGDIVIVAGKGHETTQIVGTQVLDFDDRQVVRQLLGVAQ